MNSKMTLPMLAVAGLTAATSADVFTDRAEFDAANPDLPILDFEGIAPKGGFLEPAPDFSPFGVTFSDHVGDSSNIAIADSGFFFNTPTDVLFMNVFTTPLLMTFDPHVFAAGLDVAIGFGGLEATVEAFNGDTLLDSLSFDTELQTVFTTFIGFSNLGDDITHILVTPQSGGFVLIDNLAFEESVDSDGDGIPDAEDSCPNSDLAETIVIDGCDSGVDNMLFEDGCAMADLIAECADGASNHGDFVSCVAHLTNEWKDAGLISGQEKAAIQSCAAQSTIPVGLPLVGSRAAAVCPVDINGDGAINVLDLIDLLLCFGQPAIPGCVGADINEDGTVNVLDLVDLLLEFGQACP